MWYRRQIVKVNASRQKLKRIDGVLAVSLGELRLGPLVFALFNQMNCKSMRIAYLIGISRPSLALFQMGEGTAGVDGLLHICKIQ